MADNKVFEAGDHIALVVTDPAAPASGDPVRIGKLTGVAVLDEGDGGVGATETVVDLSNAVWNLNVDDDAATGIAVGDALYYQDVATGSPATHINNNSTTPEAFFGYALEVLGTNATGVIRVKHVLQQG